MQWRFFLYNLVEGTIEIKEPISYREMALKLVRDRERHGVMKEFTVDFTTADANAVKYLTKIYETQLIDTNVEIIIQEFNENQQWEEVYRGKLNIDQNTRERTRLGAKLFSGTVTATDNDMRFFSLRDQPIDLEANIDYEDGALTAYSKLPFDLVLKPRTILRLLDLRNDYVPVTQLANTNGYGQAIIQTSCAGTTNDYASELLVDEWTIPIDNQAYSHFFTAYIPVAFNNHFLDELDISSDFEDTVIYPTIGSMPTIIQTDAYTTAQVDVYAVGTIASCILFCTEGGTPKMQTPGASGWVNAGMDAVSITFKVDIGGVNVHSSVVYSGSGLGYNGTTTNFLSNSGDYWLFDYYANLGANTATIIDKTSSIHAPITGSASDIIDKRNFTESWSGVVPELSYCKIYLEISFGGTYENTYAGNPAAGVYQKLYGFAQALFTDDTELKAVVTHKFKNTRTKAFMVHEALSRCVEAITSNEMKVYSEYYGRTDSEPFAQPADGCGSLRMITTGLHVRQFPSHLDVAKAPYNKARMAVSFDKLFEALNAIDCLGYGIEVDPTDSEKKVIRVEPAEHFYNVNEISMYCDNVSQLKRSVITEFYLSKISAGYTKWQAETTMGLDEFNTSREFRSSLKTIKRSLDKKCEFIASGYTLEVVRHDEFANDSTKDNSFDNDTFIVCLRRGAEIEVERGQDCLDTAGTFNVIDPESVYNARISPSRNLIRWLKIANISYFPLWNSSDASWKFAKGEGNYNVEMEIINGCTYGAGLIIENSSISYSAVSPTAYAKPFLKPDLVEYEYPCSWRDYNKLKNSPYKAIAFREFDSRPWEYGLIDEIEYKPHTGKAVFKLIIAQL